MFRFSEALLLGCILVASLCGSASARDIYKWTDAEGRVHYSDRAGGKAPQNMELRQPSGTPTAAPGDRQAYRKKLLRAYDEERAIEKKQAAERLAQRQLRAKNCVAAKKNLSSYENARYLYDDTGNGERRVLSFSEREEATESMRETVAHWCGKS